MRNNDKNKCISVAKYEKACSVAPCFSHMGPNFESTKTLVVWALNIYLAS